jgi:hypothetical protein
MIQTLNSTTNFTIEYQDGFANAKQRALKLYQTCESEFALLRTWFQNTTGFGPGNRVTLQVEQAQLAINYGYRTDGKTKIVMNPFDSEGTSSLADDAVQALFIAEIIEVLMGCRDVQTGNTTWQAGKSDGEGLSRMAAGLLHPASYYTLLGGPYVNGWLQSDTRPDWISTSENTDKDRISFGCSILLLYYLRYQLGHSMTEIITEAGPNLEQTYHALTGVGGAYAAFSQFLETFFPIGQTAALKTDNPFPVKQGQQRTVQLSFTQESNGEGGVQSEGTAHVSPFFPFCPVKDYSYQILNTPVLLRCTASTVGFAQPVYEWNVNGIGVSMGTITPVASVFTDDPDHPNAQNSINETIKIDCAEIGDTSTYLAVSDEFDITSVDHLGHEQLAVQVSVREKFASNDKTTTLAFAMLDTQMLVYEAQYYEDGAACKRAFDTVTKRIRGALDYNWIPLILTLPDPPPDLYRSMKVYEQIVGDMQIIAKRDPELASKIATAMSGVLQVSQKLLSAEK